MRVNKFSLFLAVCSTLLSLVSGLCQNEADGSFIPDPTSRSRFFYCRGGQGILGNCDPGMEFNPFDRTCEVMNGNIPRDPCFLSSDGTFLPDPTSRNRFLFCENGRSTVGSCPDGMVFFEAGYCDFDDVPTTRQPPLPPQNRDPCFNQPDGTFLPDPTSRNRFLFCENGRSTVGSCPADMVFFEEGYCDVDDAPGNPCTNQPDGSFVPDPKSRNGFFFCENGQGISGNCPVDLIFDDGSCVADSESTTRRPIPTPPQTTTRATPPTRTTTRAPNTRPTPPNQTTNRTPPNTRPTPPGQTTRPPPNTRPPPPGQTTRPPPNTRPPPPGQTTRPPPNTRQPPTPPRSQGGPTRQAIGPTRQAIGPTRQAANPGQSTRATRPTRPTSQ